MKREIIVNVTPDRQLKIPTEIQSQLTPGDRYTITMTEDSLVFQKIKKGFDWDEWERQVEAANPDPNQLTTEEICEIVQEVRYQNSLKND
ncbi:MAG: hypothetical protein F6K17_14495 [Okeania sp. SIO3C4]|nr:hypothetical protein [Okeania sp. SIO3B3]NER03738.1 hypothetical protein [Okeania sp. SIO3C4]